MGAIGQLTASKSGKITMQPGWEKLPLPMISNTNPENPAEKPVQNEPNQLPSATPAASGLSDSASQQALEPGKVIDETHEMITVMLKKMGDMATQRTNGNSLASLAVSELEILVGCCGARHVASPLVSYVARREQIGVFSAALSAAGGTSRIGPIIV